MFAGRYSPMWGTVSDIAALTLIAAPIPVLWADEGFLPMLNDMVVVYQSALLAGPPDGRLTPEARREGGSLAIAASTVINSTHVVVSRARARVGPRASGACYWTSPTCPPSAAPS